MNDDRTGWSSAVITALLLPIVVFLAYLACAVVAEKAHGHDSWINRGGYHNKMNQLCCGDRDCHVVTRITHEVQGGFEVKGRISVAGTGVIQYEIEFDETVPYKEALPSEDNDYHICGPIFGGNVATMQRRCVFAPIGSF